MTKIIMKNLANKSQKPPRVRGAGEIKSVLCDNHMECTHNVCRQNSGFFTSIADDIYSYYCVFKRCKLL